MCADYQSDSDSFNPTLWEEQRQQRMTVAFDFEDKKEEEDNSGKVKVSKFWFELGSDGKISHPGSSNSWVNVFTGWILCFHVRLSRSTFVFVGWDKPEALPNTLPRGP